MRLARPVRIRPRRDLPGALAAVDHQLLELDGPMGRGVARADHRAGTLGDGPPVAIGERPEGRDDLARRSSDQDLAPGREERVEPRPRVADDRDAAGGGLEEEHTRAVAGAYGIGP